MPRFEEDRLDYIRANQDSFRTEGLKGIHKALKAGNTSTFSVAGGSFYQLPLLVVLDV